MSKECKAIVFRCMDYRLTKEVYRWLAQEDLLNHSDIVSIAGSDKSFLAKRSTRDYLVNQINLSKKLHKVTEIILIHHSDCGAYKQEFKFRSKEEEKVQQLKDLEKTEKIIRQNFSNLKIIKIWAELKDKNGQRIVFHRV